MPNEVSVFIVNCSRDDSIELINNTIHFSISTKIIFTHL